MSGEERINNENYYACKEMYRFVCRLVEGRGHRYHPISEMEDAFIVLLTNKELDMAEDLAARYGRERN